MKYLQDKFNETFALKDMFLMKKVQYEFQRLIKNYLDIIERLKFKTQKCSEDLNWDFTNYNEWKEQYEKNSDRKYIGKDKL